MARETRNLTIAYSAEALATLDEIWDWNAREYGPEHASKYVAFLRTQTNKLTSAYFKGKAVPTVPRLSYILVKRKRKGHGHLAVYELIGDVIHVLQYYHTAQDWQNKIAAEHR